MRVTVLDDDQGERIKPGRERIAVYLNGEEVSRCITADDEAGEVVEVATDEHGRMVTENGEVMYRTRYGHVRIERRLR